MRKVFVSEELNVPPQRVWDLITDLENYPKYVKFVKSVKYNEPLKLNSQFSDVTKIAWIPLKIKHTVDIFDKNKTLGFFVKMPLGGKMYQRAVLTPSTKGTRFDLWIEFTHGNPVSDFFAAPILSKRIKQMLEYIIEKGKKDFDKT